MRNCAKENFQRPCSKDLLVLMQLKPSLLTVNCFRLRHQCSENCKMTGNEKLCEGKLATSLLEGSIGSDAAQTFIIDRKLFQIATTVQRKLQNDDMEVLGLSLFPLQKKNGRYVTGRLQ